ncbi:MAG: hypothetical protein N2C14_26155, partial [Planctomycetales bacterium]
DGFGFPAGAGGFRFRAECKIVNRLIQGANPDEYQAVYRSVADYQRIFAARFPSSTRKRTRRTF